MRKADLFELEFNWTRISSRDLFSHLIAYPKSLWDRSTFEKDEERVGISIDDLFWKIRSDSDPGTQLRHRKGETYLGAPMMLRFDILDRLFQCNPTH
jgi:hypothetical protein